MGTRQDINGKCPVHQSRPGPGARGGLHSGIVRTCGPRRRRGRGFGPHASVRGWARIRAQMGALDEPSGDNIPLALLGWVAGCVAIWSSLFAVGNFLYGRTGRALWLTAIFALSGVVLMRIVGTLWSGPGAEEDRMRV